MQVIGYDYNIKLPCDGIWQGDKLLALLTLHVSTVVLSNVLANSVGTIPPKSDELCSQSTSTNSLRFSYIAKKPIMCNQNIKSKDMADYQLQYPAFLRLLESLFVFIR